jgi:endonuclease/exonuclease/phosphatase family metal-dependent hydrolase
VTRLVVASYNIHRGVGLDRRRNLDRIAAVIAEIAPDVIGLQEVVRERAQRAPHRDQAAYLAAALGLDLVMGETRRHGDGTYGNAVLTRLPVVGTARHDLSRDGREPRGCLRVDLAVNGTCLHLFNCHLGLVARERLEQLGLLGRVLGAPARLPGPRVLLGDFNEWRRGPVGRRLAREFRSPVGRVRRTHPAVFPLFALDRIYWDGALEGEAFHVHRSRLARMASDHLPVVARLRVRPPAASWMVGAALRPSE